MGRRSDGVEPGHTPRPRIRSKGAHAVEFSKTVAPLQGVVLFRGAPRTEQQALGRTGEYSARRPDRADFSGDLDGANNRRGIVAGVRAERRPPSSSPRLERCLEREATGRSYETTWTVTTRWRGRSSKSISTTCCHVPSARAPSSSGIVSEGPITAARRCAWAFESWLRALCW